MTKEKTQQAEIQQVEAFVLRDCGFARAGEVVFLSASDAEAGKNQGMIDLNPAAIKAAKERQK